MQTRARKKQHVVIKTKNDMPPVLKATKLFCRFKMDGCSHCVESQEDWDKTCTSVAGALNPECIIAEIESKLLPLFKLRDTFKPDGFPTHAVFENGKHVENAEDRSFQGLMQTLQKHNFIRNPKRPLRKTNRRKLRRSRRR